MDAKEVARTVMRTTKTSQTEVAQRMGLTGQSNVSMFLQSKSMRVEALLTILHGCGYQLIARDPSGKYPTFVIGEDVGPIEPTTVGKATDEAAVRKIVAEEIARVMNCGA